MPEFVAGKHSSPLVWHITNGGEQPMKKSEDAQMPKKEKQKVQFVVSREFSGEKTMQEAFEQVIERQTCEQFENWLERKAG